MVEIRRGEYNPINAGTIGAAIGTVAAGPIGGLAGKILADALASAVIQAGQQPTNPMGQVTAIETAPDVVKNALEDPRIQDLVRHVDNVTNNESPAKSIVTQGAVLGGGVGGIVAVILAGGELIGYDLTPKTASLTVFTAGMLSLGGMVWTLYGRWKAKKPLIGG